MTINQQSSLQAKFNIKKLAILLIVTIIAAVVILATPGILVQNQTATPQNWIKIGAYSTYEGQTTILSFTVTFNARMEIVDLNDTQVEIQTSIDMSTPYGSNQNTTTTWVNRSNMTFQPEGLTLNSNRTEQVSIPHIGTRTCTVYEYKNQDITATYYVDNQIQWPIKMTITTPITEGQSYSMNINLVDSNIPGLT
jgi:hypothetical protein